VKGTRGEIVELLRRHGELTVHGFMEHLPMAAAALRRHLESSIGAATVELRSVKQSTGRPYYVDRLSEQARERLAAGYPRLMERLILEAATLRAPVENGERGLEGLFNGVSDRLGAEHRPKVWGETLEQRVDSLTVALREEGILENWSQREDGYHLFNSSCPHHRAARASSGLCCSSERRAIALLLDTDVEQVGRIAEGRPVCEYIVHTTPGGAAEPADGEKQGTSWAGRKTG